MSTVAVLYFPFWGKNWKKPSPNPPSRKIGEFQTLFILPSNSLAGNEKAP
jgi:hypothetical protein